MAGEGYCIAWTPVQGARQIDLAHHNAAVGRAAQHDHFAAIGADCWSTCSQHGLQNAGTGAG